jgi:hypothetical protein
MERGDEEEKVELASPGSGAGDKDSIFSTRGGGRGPAAVTFPISKIRQSSQGDSLKHKEQLSLLANL